MLLRIEKIVKVVSSGLCSLLFLILFILEIIQMSQGIYSLFEDPGAGFRLYFFRMLSCLIGLILGIASIWASLSKKDVCPFLNPVCILYCFLLSLIIYILGSPLFGLANDLPLLAFPMISGIALALSIYRLIKDRKVSKSS